jgi:hypothetical protein
MQPLRAHVRNGRLVLDEPTDLPEGQMVELVPRETPAERHAVIAERVARVRSGDATTLSMEEVERSLRDELDL